MLCPQWCVFSAYSCPAVRAELEFCPKTATDHRRRSDVQIRLRVSISCGKLAAPMVQQQPSGMVDPFPVKLFARKIFQLGI